MVVAKPALTEAIQDYLREIYKLGADGSRVSVTALAKQQGVSPASASGRISGNQLQLDIRGPKGRAAGSLVKRGG